MIINALDIKNFRNFEALRVDFHQGVNLFVGINGSGKTALLEAINIISGSYLQQNPVVKHYAIEPSQVRMGFEENKFIDRFPVKVMSVLTFQYPEGEKSFKVYRVKSSRSGRTTTSKAYGASNLGYLHYHKSDPKHVLPVISFYSTQRLHVSKRKTDSPKRMGKFEGYFNCLDPENNLRYFLDWWRKAEIDELKEKQINTNFFDPQLRLVKGVLGRVLGEEIDFESGGGFYYSLQLAEFVTVFRDGNRLPFSKLSDGYRNLIGLFADLAYRIGTLNYSSLGVDCLTETFGVVAIDEIDLHLHPKWQAKVIALLQEIFPNIQFFITTHSPIVVSSFDKGHLYTIEGNKVNPEGTFYGKDINTTISDLFEANERGSAEMQEKADEFQTLMGTKAFDSARYKLLRKDLTEILGDLDPLVVRAKTLEKLFGK